MKNPIQVHINENTRSVSRFKTDRRDVKEKYKGKSRADDVKPHNLFDH